MDNNHQELIDLLDQFFGSDSVTIFKTLPSKIKFLITEYKGIEQYYICDTPFLFSEEDFFKE